MIKLASILSCRWGYNWFGQAKDILCDKRYYYLTTNEIPGELLRKNMMSSHMRITFVKVTGWLFLC